eukprot:9091818-Prorocentrum_lima.AAC.1
MPEDAPAERRDETRDLFVERLAEKDTIEVTRSDELWHGGMLNPDLYAEMSLKNEAPLIHA